MPDPHGKLTPQGQRIEDAAELRAIATRLDAIQARAKEGTFRDYGASLWAGVAASGARHAADALDGAAC